MVSIGMPVYNSASLLPGALKSLLGQSYERIELIAGNNASTDATAEVLEEAARSDGRIRVIHQTSNIGAWPNFTRVLREARGDYFMWAAADDLWEPDFIQRLVELHENYPGLVLAMSRYDRFSHVTSEFGTIPGEGYPSLSAGRTRFENLMAYLRCGASEFIYGLHRREVIENCRNVQDLNFDFADVALVNELITQGPVHLRSEVLFHSGHVSSNTLKTMSRTRWPGCRLNYMDYYRRSKRVIADADFAAGEKAQLLRALKRQVVRMIASYEPAPRRALNLLLSLRRSLTRKPARAVNDAP